MHCNQTIIGMYRHNPSIQVYVIYVCVARNRWITVTSRQKRVLPTCAMRATQVVTEVVLHGYTSMEIYEGHACNHDHEHSWVL